MKGGGDVVVIREIDVIPGQILIIQAGCE